MRTIRHFVDQRAASQPDRLYLIAPETGRTISYADLRRQSIALTRHLCSLGLAKGDKVSLMAHNGYQSARVFLGAMYGGFVVQPINLLAQASQLEYVLEHSDSQAVFVAEAYRERLNSALARIAPSSLTDGADSHHNKCHPRGE